jgi:hypothetical protein
MTRQNEQDRQSKLEALFQKHYSELQNMSFEDPRLLVYDAANIIQALGAKLVEYDGDAEDEPFLTWAGSVIRPAVARVSTFYQWMQEYRDSVRSGIWSILGKNLDLSDHSNPSAIAERIEFDTWFWALQHIDDLLTPGSARLSTRLYAQGRFHALTWRKTRLRALERFDDSDVERYGLMEIMGVDESGEIAEECSSFYDPGGHDDDEEDEPPRQQTKFLPIPAPSDGILAMRSGIPRLLCSSCQSLQKISPDPPTEPDVVRLDCGHERPVLLPISAAALKG